MSLREELERRNAGLPPRCMVISDNTPTLTVHLANGDSWAGPWSRFIRCWHRGEVLSLLFADDEVVVHGQNLASVFKDAAQMKIELLRTMPANYRQVVEARETFIREIEVRPVKL